METYSHAIHPLGALSCASRVYKFQDKNKSRGNDLIMQGLNIQIEIYKHSIEAGAVSKSFLQSWEAMLFEVSYEET